MRKKLFRTFSSVVLVVVLLLSVASISASAEYKATVANDGTIARTGPGNSYPVFAILNTGTKVTVVDMQTDGWCKVLIGGNYAYIHCWYLSMDSYTITPTNFAAYINTNGVAMRIAPGSEYAAVTTLNKGQVVVVIEEHSSGWCGVLVNGIPGFVYGSYVTPGYYVTPTSTSVNYTAYVNTNGTNIRIGPDQAFASMCTLPYGFEVTVVQELSNGWYGVTVNGIPGFIYGSYLSNGPYINSYNITLSAADYDAYINTDGTQFRVAPNTDYPSMISLPKGIPVHVVSETSNGWCGCMLNGIPGFVYGAFVSRGTFTPEPIAFDLPLTYTDVNYPAYINTDYVEVRNYPNSTGASMGTLSYGVPVTVVRECSNGYYGILLGAVPGFVYCAYLTPGSPP